MKCIAACLSHVGRGSGQRFRRTRDKHDPSALPGGNFGDCPANAPGRAHHNDSQCDHSLCGVMTPRLATAYRGRLLSEQGF